MAKKQTTIKIQLECAECGRKLEIKNNAFEDAEERSVIFEVIPHVCKAVKQG